MSHSLSIDQRSDSPNVLTTSVLAGRAVDESLCSSCATYQHSLCAAIRKKGDSEPSLRACAQTVVASVHTVPARRLIIHPADSSEFVPIICQGWATDSVALPDGRRQILSFLLPGDMVSAAIPFEPVSGRLIEAVTDVTYRNYKRSDLKAAVLEHPDLLDILLKTWIEEKRQAEQLAVDLGRRTADERVARLILNLVERLAKRGMAQDQTIEFPLRQHHVADAAGLTTVHVSKVLSEFRRAGLIAIDRRMLTVLKPAELHRVASVRKAG